jgi:DUF3047 family protein
MPPLLRSATYCSNVAYHLWWTRRGKERIDVAMRVTAVALVICWVMMPFPERAEGQIAGDQTKALDTFETDQPLTFPQNWQVRGNEEVARDVYQIAEENGNHFLHAHAEKQDVQIGLTRSFQTKEFPVLQWRWRVKQLPTGGNERATKTNDSAAGVYVVFDSTVVPRVLKYVWSSTLPVGTQLTSPVYWRCKVIVLESGPGQGNEWKTETVDVYRAYKNAFEAEPGEVQGIAVLTDSDATKSIADADYDDFALLTASAAKGAEKGAPPGQAASALVGEQ